MSLNYLLDGYNIIKRHPLLAQKGLKESRDQLISWIEIYRPQGSANNTITVVFDGQRDVFGNERTSSVNVVFSKGESADDYIKRVVDDSSFAKSIVVVTEDKDIKFYVRAKGAKVMGVDEFTVKFQSHGEKSKAPGAKKKKDEDKHISHTMEHKINKEFKNIWLNSDQDKKKDHPSK